MTPLDGPGHHALSTPALTQTDLALGRALADLVLGRHVWCHRKVETLDLQEGERGRRRVSLDCTPPPDPRLAYDQAERVAQRAPDAVGPVVVPLAFVTKGALRHLDVTDAAGLPLPVLGRPECGRATASMLYSLLTPAGERAPEVLELVHSIVREDPDPARTALAKLFGDEGVLAGTVVPVAPVHDLARTLADSSLLMVLLPAGQAGRRQVLRFRFHWASAAAGHSPQTMASRLWRTSLRVTHAFGYGSSSLDVRVPGVADAASYHLEVHAPPGLQCASLTLPSAPGAELVHDASYGNVAHASGSYRCLPGPDDRTGEPHDVAMVRLAVPVAGLRMRAALASVFTATVFGLAQAHPEGRAALDVEREDAAAILLALAALVLVLLTRRSDNPVTAQVLLPLQVVVLLCAGLLSAGAGSLVLGLGPPYVDVLWWSAAALATLIAVPLVASLPDVASDRGAPSEITTIEGAQHHARPADAPAVTQRSGLVGATAAYGSHKTLP